LENYYGYVSGMQGWDGGTNKIHRHLRFEERRLKAFIASLPPEDPRKKILKTKAGEE